MKFEFKLVKLIIIFCGGKGTIKLKCRNNVGRELLIGICLILSLLFFFPFIWLMPDLQLLTRAASNGEFYDYDPILNVSPRNPIKSAADGDLWMW